MSDNRQTADTTMNDRQRVMNLLHYRPVDRLPIVHFGFWRPQTLLVWAGQGHITEEMARGWSDGNPVDAELSAMLGFDFDWASNFSPSNWLRPTFESKVVRDLDDGAQHILTDDGVIELHREGATSIHAEIDHTLKDRASWEEHYKWRFEFTPERITRANVRVGDKMVRWDAGGLDFLQADTRDYHYGISCGSMIGRIRNIVGVENLSYLQVDDPELLDEMIDTSAELCYRTTEYALSAGAKFDFAHFWEDISFKSGPLVSPRFFRDKLVPHYKRITQLLADHGVDIVSVDSDGKIDELVPIWLEAGVNTMFPIEVGTWDASIAPWREQLGRDLRGVGGMNKVVFSRDRSAVDAEVERLRPLVELGGYIPCPDHRIPPDAKWDLVRYYTDRMRETFG